MQRQGNFKGEIQLALNGLPENIKVFNAKIAVNKNSVDLQFFVPPETKIGTHRLSLKGTGDLGDQNATRGANHPAGPDHVLMGIVPRIPFKHTGQYRIVTGLPGGTTFFRHYSLKRGGFDGPLTVQLADKQIRHLQGITDRIVYIPAKAVEFDFPIDFPSRVEVGRTSRVQVMVVGEMTDFDGTKHKISYTSNARDDQLISVAAAGLVSLETLTDSFTVAPNSEFTIPLTVRREPTLRQFPMKVELNVPTHVEGIFAAPIELAPGQSTGTLVGSLLAVIVVAAVISHYLPELPLLKHIVLKPPGNAQDGPVLDPRATGAASPTELLEANSELVGQQGFIRTAEVAPILKGATLVGENLSRLVVSNFWERGLHAFKWA